MTDNDKLIEKLKSKDSKEHGKNIIIAAISGLPAIGGPLSSLLSEYLPDWKQKRILNFLDQLSDKLNELEEEIDDDYINSKEFAYLFEQTFLAVTKNYQEEKLTIFRSILVNSCINNKLDTTQKEYFLSIAMKLESIHIQILSLFYDTELYCQKYNLPLNKFLNINTLKGIIKAYLYPFSYEENLIIAAINELENYRFFNNLVDSLDRKIKIKNIKQLENRLSNFGKTFCEFIISK